MAFEYKSSTKNAYKSSEVAKGYHSDFTEPLNWRRSRFRFIANRERRAIALMLARLQAASILDVPCGTGKLAPLLSKGRYRVVAADVSPDMLAIAKDSYTRAGLTEARFATCDVESLSRMFAMDNIDVVICLRLMHRVPREIRLHMLSEIAKTSQFAIVSFGLRSTYHALRRRLRNVLFGGGVGHDLCPDTLANHMTDLAQSFTVLRRISIAPFISEEIVFLLKSKLHLRPTRGHE